MPNYKLQPLLNKIRFARTAITSAKGQVEFAGGLWYHAVGLMNAFYAVDQELVQRVKNGPDTVLRDAIDSWREANLTQLHSFFGTARNSSTHSGNISTETFYEMISHDFLDIEERENYAVVTVPGSPIQNLRGSEFLAIAENAFAFLDSGIRSIEISYKAAGGVGDLFEPDRYDIASLF